MSIFISVWFSVSFSTPIDNGDSLQGKNSFNSISPNYPFFTVRLNYRVFFTGGVDFDDLPGHCGVEGPMGQSEAC